MSPSNSKLPPDEKALPSPRTNTTSTSSSRSITRQTSAISRCIRGETAFRPGPSKTISRMPGSGRSSRKDGKSAYRSVMSKSDPLGDEFPVIAGNPEQQLRCLGPLEIQMCRVLPGETDATVDLDVLRGT